MVQEEMDPNALLRSMVTIRGLTEGGNRIPVRKFEGTLMAVVPRQQQQQGDTVPRLFADLKFADCVVIETTQPYPFDTVELGIRVSNRKNSGWGYFSESLIHFVPADKDIYDCIGTRMALHTESRQFGFDRTKVQPKLVNGVPAYDAVGQPLVEAMPIIADVWIVSSISGLNGATGPAQTDSKGLEAALTIIDGKTESEFHDSAWASSEIKADPSISSMILGRTFIGAMIASGRIQKDATDIYHLVKERAT